MKKNGIKNLVIDFGGVLVDLESQRCVEEFNKIGLFNTEDLLGTSHQEGFFQDYEKGLISSEEFRDEIRKRIGDKDISDDQIDAAWVSFLDDIPRNKLDLLLRLREHYVVYLLSNTNPIHWKWATEFGFPYRGFRVEDYFEHIFLSHEMHMLKPSTEIYEAVLQTTGIDPKESFLIDDSKENCDAAKALGFTTYTPKPKEDWTYLFE